MSNSRLPVFRKHNQNTINVCQIVVYQSSENTIKTQSKHNQRVPNSRLPVFRKHNQNTIKTQSTCAK